MIKIPPFGSWSLKTKFALCSGALMGVFSVLFTIWTLHNVESDLHASVVDAQLALARSTAGDIDAKIDLRREAMVTIAPLLAMAAPAPGAPMDDFFRPRPVLKKIFDDVLVVSADGTVVHDMPSGTAEPVVGHSVAGQDFFKRLKAGSPLVISSPFKAVADSTPYVAFAAPLRAADGTVTGALVGLLNPAHGNFLGDLGKVRIGKEGYFVIVERNDQPLTALHPEPELIMSPPRGVKNFPLVASALQGREGTVGGMSTVDSDALRTYEPLRSVPWVLVALYPTAEAFTGLQARRKEVLAVGAVLFALASVAAWLMTSWLLRPLVRLQLLMARHALDPGLSIASESFGSTELAALVAAYNSQAAARREFEDRLHASEQRVRDIADNMPASIAYVDKDERYTFANARVVGQHPDFDGTILGSTLRQVRGDTAYGEIASYVVRALRGQTINFESRDFAEGRSRHSQSHFIPDRDEAGHVRGFYKMTFDITALKEAQGRQALVEQRLRAITDHLPALIAHVDKDERYDFMNDTFRIWMGIDPSVALGRHMADVIGAEVYATRRERVARCLAGEASSFEMDVPTQIGRKTLRIEYLPDVDCDGSVAGMYTFSSDVTELMDAQLQLSRLVRSDSLTGLHNRFQFEESLPLAVARAKRSGLGLALMFLDVDNFKQINDGFGHDVGDQILKEFACRVKRCVRTTDTTARLGGDEFVVILEGLHHESEAERVAKNIVEEVRRPFDALGKMLKVTTSVGIAFRQSAETADNASAILKRADAALYAAKAAGRDSYHVASDSGPSLRSLSAGGGLRRP